MNRSRVAITGHERIFIYLIDLEQMQEKTKPSPLIILT